MRLRCGIKVPAAMSAIRLNMDLMARAMKSHMLIGTSFGQSLGVYLLEKEFMAELRQFSVIFHSMDPSEAVRQRGELLLERLARLAPGIMRGRMMIESRHRRHHQGNVFHVSVQVHLAGVDVEVTNDPDLNHAHEDVYVAMRDAFNAAKRQLGERGARRSGKGARHEQRRFNDRPEQQPS